MRITSVFGPARARARGGLRSERGGSLVEALLAVGIVVVVSGGLASLYGISMRSTVINSANTELLSAVRAKLEQVQVIPYEQVGIVPSGGETGPGYIVFDPFATPFYKAANGDDLLSDTVTLRDGTRATRTVTVTAVDDPADGSGTGDADDARDPNTDTILDYKRVTVTATATLNGYVVSQTLSTFVRGTMEVERNGAAGDGSTGTVPTSTKKAKKTKEDKEKTETDDDGCSETSTKKKKAGKKDSSKSTC